MMSDQCGECRYFRHGNEPDAGEDGYCARFPPQLIREDERFAWHPKVPPYNWCGEFKAAEPAQ